MILLVSCICSILAFPLIRGIYSPYYEVADSDLHLTFSALIFNTNIPLDFHTHDGYLYTTILALWMKINHWLYLIPTADLQQFFDNISINGFGDSITPLIISGRVFSILLGLLFISGFVFGLYLYFNNWCYALLGGLLLSTTGSFMAHTLIMRFILLSAFFLMLAVFIVLLYTKDRILFNPIYLFLVGFFSMLSLMARTPSIIGVLLLPVLFIIFRYYNRVCNEKLEYDKIYYKEIFIISLIISMPFLIHFLSYFWQNDTFQVGVNTNYIAKYGAFRYVGDRLIYYAIFLYLLIMTLIYNYLSVKSIKLTVALSFLIVSGIASAYYLHMIHYDKRFFAPIIFFYDYFKAVPGEDISLFYTLGSSIISVLYSKINPIAYFDYPFMFFQAFVFIVVIICMYKKDYRKYAFQALALILCAWLMELFFGMRHAHKLSVYNPKVIPFIYRVWVDFFYIISLLIVLKIKRKENHILERVDLFTTENRFLPKLRNISFVVIMLSVFTNTADSYLREKENVDPYQLQPISIVVNPIAAGFFPQIYEFIVKDSDGACKDDVYDYTQECEEYLMKGLKRSIINN